MADVLRVVGNINPHPVISEIANAQLQENCSPAAYPVTPGMSGSELAEASNVVERPEFMVCEEPPATTATRGVATTRTCAVVTAEAPVIVYTAST